MTVSIAAPAIDLQTTAADIRRGLDAAAMSRTQILVIAITVMLSALDGFDVLSTSFVAPVLSRSWHLGSAALGLVLASGLVGMALGSLVLAPLADVFGRRPALIGGGVLTSLGSLMSALCRGPVPLSASRMLTGLGIGLAIALITALAAEFSNARRRALSMAAMAVGYPAGALAGGLVAAVLLKTAGWPPVFLVGAGLGAALLIFVAVALPESPAFLANSGAPGALVKLNRVLVSLDQPPVSALVRAPGFKRASYGSLFATDLLGPTLRLAVVSLLYAMGSYYVLSWLPQLVAKAGYGASSASLVSATASLVGIASGLLVGAAAVVVQPRRLACAAMIGLGLALFAFGYAPGTLPALIAAAAACGVFLFGGVGVFYVTLAGSFPALSRATGVGFVMGVGRVSSALGPYLAGQLFQAGWGRASVSAMFGVGVALGGVILITPSPARQDARSR